MSIFLRKVDYIVKNFCVEGHIDLQLPCHLNAFSIFVRLIKKFNSVLGRYGFLFCLIKSSGFSYNNKRNFTSRMNFK